MINNEKCILSGHVFLNNLFEIEIQATFRAVHDINQHKPKTMQYVYS